MIKIPTLLAIVNAAPSIRSTTRQAPVVPIIRSVVSGAVQPQPLNKKLVRFVNKGAEIFQQLQLLCKDENVADDEIRLHLSRFMSNLGQVLGLEGGSAQSSPETPPNSNRRSISQIVEDHKQNTKAQLEQVNFQRTHEATKQTLKTASEILGVTNNLQEQETTADDQAPSMKETLEEAHKILVDSNDQIDEARHELATYRQSARNIKDKLENVRIKLNLPKTPRMQNQIHQSAHRCAEQISRAPSKRLPRPESKSQDASKIDNLLFRTKNKQNENRKDKPRVTFADDTPAAPLATSGVGAVHRRPKTAATLTRPRY